jgi:hypothetical protein
VRRILYVAIENENVSGLGLPRAGNDAQKRRLSDSIGPDEPDHAAGRKFDRDRVEGDRSTVTLREAFDALDRTRERSLPDVPLQLWRPGDRRIESQIGNTGQTASHRIGTRAQSLGIDPHPDPEHQLVTLALGPHRLGMTYSRSHRRAGIGACFLMMTHARLRCSLSSARNSARPTVTVRPSGRGTVPPAASTADQVAFCG